MDSLGALLCWAAIGLAGVLIPLGIFAVIIVALAPAMGIWGAGLLGIALGIVYLMWLAFWHDFMTDG